MLLSIACPACRRPLRRSLDQQILEHDTTAQCPETYPVIDDIPRLLLPGAARRQVATRHADWFRVSPARTALGRVWQGQRSGTTVADAVIRGFDDEWAEFDSSGTSEHRDLFARYFSLLPAERLRGCTVLDAGCGAGRWAVEVTRAGGHVIGVDMGASVETAARSVRTIGHGEFLQADLLALPLVSASVDHAYSLGVLHHLTDPRPALERIVEAVRPGGEVLVYMYYALEQRPAIHRWLLAIVTAIRAVTARLPRPVLRAFAFVVATTVYVPLARASRLLRTLGRPRLAASLPLAFYADRSFRTMWNDSVDRFGTAIEHRYRRDEIESLMRDAGLIEIRFAEDEPCWRAIGRRPEPRARTV